MNDDEIAALDARAILGPLADLPAVESEAHAAMRSFADSLAADLQLRQAVAVARYIADMAHWPPLTPWAALGWTRRRWVRARKRWNAERRRWPIVVVVARPDPALDGDALLAMLHKLSSDWRAVVPEPLRTRHFPTTWAEHVRDRRSVGALPRYR